jgi:predicted nuclease of predicted toxin-antitoxin system
VADGFLLDADCPPAVATALGRLGHDVVAASSNPALEALADDDLLRKATRQGRTLVTFNVADFSEAARSFAHAQENHAGIILIHARSYPRTNIGAIARALDRLLRSRQSLANSVLFL